jgi:hypothetical protein
MTISKMSLFQFSITIYSARYKVFTAVNIHIVVFLIMTPCSLIGGYQYFGGMCASTFSVTLKMEAACSSETLVLTCQIIHCHNLENNIIFLFCQVTRCKWVETRSLEHSF